MERSRSDNSTQTTDRKDIQIYHPISLLSPMYKVFTESPKSEWKNLDDNQHRENAGFRKGFATTNHLHTINQIIEKSIESTPSPLCIIYIDYKKPSI